MKRIKALAIAPYEGLSKLIADLADDLADIDLQVQVGDMEAGAKFVTDTDDMRYDFILSRGGTADLIKQSVKIPVVEIRLSEYDILQAIKLAQSFAGKFCVVGFPSIISRIHTICNLMQIDVCTHEITSGSQVLDSLSHLKKQGFTLVVGGPATIAAAKSMQINGILITSGRESILSALDEGRNICRAMLLAQKRNLFFRDILDYSQIYVLVYGVDGHLLYSNITTQNSNIDSSPALRSIPSYINSVMEQGEIHLLRRSKGFLWNIKGVRADEGHAYFYVNRTMDVSALTQSISIRDTFRNDDPQPLPFYNTYEHMQSILDTAAEISRTNLPVLIFGEPGTGKDTLAYSIHQQSTLGNSSFLTINCRLLGDKQLSHLLRNENSPLWETDIAIYFKNIHYLSSDAQQMVATYLRDTSVYQRNRIIYSHALDPALAQQELLVSFLLNDAQPSCMTILLPSLRERQGDIPGLVSIYINEFNMTLGKQVAGLDSASVELLQAFPWRENIHQLIRVLKELVLTANGAFIRVDDTARVLQKEKRFSGGAAESASLEGTLDQITAGIIQRVLQEENMNQTKAAKRLGISRSTMWRKMRLL